MSLTTFSSTMQARPLSQPMRAPGSVQRRTHTTMVRAEKKVLNEKDSIPGAPGVSVPDRGEVDSYETIEEPVRGRNVPDGGPRVPDRKDGRDNLYIQTDGRAERELLGNKVSFPNLMRFNGAAPEVINSRLAMIGCVTAIAAELTTHATVVEQFAKAPLPILGTFALITAASFVTMVQGIPRKGGKDWKFGLPQFTPDAEVVVGRTAMLGFLGIVLNEYITRTPAL